MRSAQLKWRGVRVDGSSFAKISSSLVDQCFLFGLHRRKFHDVVVGVSLCAPKKKANFRPIRARALVLTFQVRTTKRSFRLSSRSLLSTAFIPARSVYNTHAECSSRICSGWRRRLSTRLINVQPRSLFPINKYKPPNAFLVALSERCQHLAASQSINFEA